MKELLSPKQVATSIGVSESSLKRWCDQGVITTERTPGGHRRIRVREVIRFLREQSHPLVRPEVLGLPVGSGQGAHPVETARQTLFDALRDGDHEQANRVVVDFYLSGASILRVCEDLITPTLHAIGDGWECGQIEVYQEHRACEFLNRILFSLRSLLPPPAPGAPTAIGGSPPGDNYRLATLMVELVLADDGWNAVSLGSSLPFATIASAIARHRPGLVWLSFSHIPDLEAMRSDFQEFLDSIAESTPIVVGGRLAEPLLAGEAEDRRVHRGANLAALREIARRLRSASTTAAERASG